MKAIDIWHSLANYQTRDLVCDAYEQRHNRKPNEKRIREITSNFVQAQEYFKNAEIASLHVQPLLLYYGVVGLTRGLIILLNKNIHESAMTPSHGINTCQWQDILCKSGLSSIASLEVKFSRGTFLELLESTQNKSYLKSNSSGVNWSVGYGMPDKILDKDTKINFQSLVSTLPDVSKEYECWTNEKILLIHVNSLEIVDNEINLKTESKNFTEADVDALMNCPSCRIKEENNQLTVSFPKSAAYYFAQKFEGSFNIGDVFLMKPVSTDINLSTIPTLYCVSYYLGMLARYFPSVWVTLDRTSKGDRIFPLIRKLLKIITERYPELIVEFLRGPYKFDE